MLYNHLECSGADCLDCIKEQQFESYFARQQYAYPENHAESADKFIGGTLKTLVPNVSVFSSPGGTKLKTLGTGSIVGNIESYVTRNGAVWWMLENGTFVEHGKGIFDLPFLENSLKVKEEIKQAEIKKAVDKRLSENDNPMYKAGKVMESIIDFDNIKTVLFVIIGIVILSLVIKLIK